MNKISTISAAIGTQLPGIAFFTGLIPPDFKAWTLLASGGALAVFLLASISSGNKEESIRKGSRRIGWAIGIAILYGVLFPQVTVSNPRDQDSKQRFQCGFGLMPFSLTNKGKELLSDKNLGIDSKEDLMLAVGGFPGGQGSSTLAWKPWTIISASAILILLFVTVYLLWASGLAYLARVIGIARL